MSPLIPGLTDWEIERVVEAVADAGARTARYIMLRLPLEVAPLMEEWLDVHAPTKKSKVLNHLRDMRGGKLNSAEFGDRMRGQGVYAELISARFRKALARHHLRPVELPSTLRTDLFRRPSADGQMALF
jgi:DNA repair photolyase